MRWPRFRLWKALALIAAVSLFLLVFQFKLYDVFSFVIGDKVDEDHKDKGESHDFSLGQLSVTEAAQWDKQPELTLPELDKHGIIEAHQEERKKPSFGLENEIPLMDEKRGGTFPDIYDLKKILKDRRQHGDPLRFRTEDNIRPEDIRPEEREQLDGTLPYNIMTAMEKTVGFFAEEHANVNLDGLFGMRMCQGRIIECIEVCSNMTVHCPEDLVSRLRALNENISKAAEMALPHAAQDNPRYYAAFKNIVEAPYKIRFIPEYLGSAKAPRGKLGNNFFGEWVNPCFAGLMGSEFEGHVIPRCTIDDFCWNSMTRDDGAEYYITHQLLYFIFGEVYGCQKELTEREGPAPYITIRERQRGFCGHIFTETRLTERLTRVNYNIEDLFVEQVLLCSILGFLDFFQESWLRMILGWQLKKGCFGQTPSGIFNVYRRNQDAAALTGRKLLTEKELADGCHSHKTGLTLGLMGVYMRYYIENLYTLAEHVM